ncbi:SRPBCC family protein [Nocardia ignorata]|uniref:Polyketide cyclase/dehydrase/lipid transport protein n=1 Tax=Nocardia ignorata TaxID=145285 RepID=A0A4R6P3D7_NOCIG|nr:SRPBCC family protein [Nocardia ignorata]TDP32248.1 polyketide cyclase/dehydrase/lipid transport protein [Nocardia ignorata]
MRSKIDIRFTVDAHIDQVMDALLAVDRLAEWSPSYSDVRMGPPDAEGRPRRVFVTAHFMGDSDTQVLEYRWEPNRVSWEVVDSSRGSKGGGSFELFEGGEVTEVDLHVELRYPLPIPGILFNRTLRKQNEEAVANFIDFAERFPENEGYAVG